MALFGFGKRKDGEAKTPACACGGACSASEAAEQVNSSGAEGKDGICCVKVLGSGCAACHALYENTQAAVKAMELAVKAEYITDLQKVMEYGVMTLPALVVNDKPISVGKVLKAGDIQKLLQKNLR